MNFKHYILTRWNLDLYGENPHKVPDVDTWMNHRVKLFEKYCLPSVMAQTCKDFTWVMAFDKSTPPGVIENYDYLKNVVICFEKPHEWLRKQQPEADWLLTTRFDNDDMLAPRFVERVQAQFNGREKVVDVQYRAYDIFKNAYYTSERTRPNSMFLSLFERWGKEPMTALGRPHSVMPDVYFAEWLPEVLAFMVVHQRNVSNKIIGNRI